MASAGESAPLKATKKSWDFDEEAHAQYKAKQEAKIAAHQKIVEKLSKLTIQPLTEEEWSKMEGKARWDSIVGLRGPDLVNSGNLKWFTSSIIRWKLSKIMRVGGMVNQQTPFIVLPDDGDYSSKRDATNFDLSHFIGHITEAAGWLKIPTTYVARDKFIAALVQNQRNHYYSAELALYPHILDPKWKQALGLLIQSHGNTLPEDEKKETDDEG